MLLKELIPGKPQTHSAYEKGIEKKYIAILSEAFEQASELSNLENLKTKVYEKSLLSLSMFVYDDIAQENINSVRNKLIEGTEQVEGKSVPLERFFIQEGVDGTTNTFFFQKVYFIPVPTIEDTSADIKSEDPLVNPYLPSARQKKENSIPYNYNVKFNNFNTVRERVRFIENFFKVSGRFLQRPAGKNVVKGINFTKIGKRRSLSRVIDAIGSNLQDANAQPSEQINIYFSDKFAITKINLEKSIEDPINSLLDAVSEGRTVFSQPAGFSRLYDNLNKQNLNFIIFNLNNIFDSLSAAAFSGNVDFLELANLFLGPTVTIEENPISAQLPSLKDVREVTQNSSSNLVNEINSLGPVKTPIELKLERATLGDPQLKQQLASQLGNLNLDSSINLAKEIEDLFSSLNLDSSNLNSIKTEINNIFGDLQQFDFSCLIAVAIQNLKSKIPQEVLIDEDFAKLALIKSVSKKFANIDFYKKILLELSLDSILNLSFKHLQIIPEIEGHSFDPASKNYFGNLLSDLLNLELGALVNADAQTEGITLPSPATTNTSDFFVSAKAGILSSNTILQFGIDADEEETSLVPSNREGFIQYKFSGYPFYQSIFSFYVNLNPAIEITDEERRDNLVNILIEMVSRVPNQLPDVIADSLAHILKDYPEADIVLGHINNFPDWTNAWDLRKFPSFDVNSPCAGSVPSLKLGTPSFTRPSIPNTSFRAPKILPIRVGFPQIEIPDPFSFVTKIVIRSFFNITIKIVSRTISRTISSVPLGAMDFDINSLHCETELGDIGGQVSRQVNRAVASQRDQFAKAIEQAGLFGSVSDLAIRDLINNEFLDLLEACVSGLLNGFDLFDFLRGDTTEEAQYRISFYLAEKSPTLLNFIAKNDEALNELGGLVGDIINIDRIEDLLIDFQPSSPQNNVFDLCSDPDIENYFDQNGIRPDAPGLRQELEDILANNRRLERADIEDFIGILADEDGMASIVERNMPNTMHPSAVIPTLLKEDPKAELPTFKDVPSFAVGRDQGEIGEINKLVLKNNFNNLSNNFSFFYRGLKNRVVNYEEEKKSAGLLSLIGLPGSKEDPLPGIYETVNNKIKEEGFINSNKFKPYLYLEKNTLKSSIDFQKINILKYSNGQFPAGADPYSLYTEKNQKLTSQLATSPFTPARETISDYYYNQIASSIDTIIEANRNRRVAAPTEAYSSIIGQIYKSNFTGEGGFTPPNYFSEYSGTVDNGAGKNAIVKIDKLDEFGQDEAYMEALPDWLKTDFVYVLSPENIDSLFGSADRKLGENEKGTLYAVNPGTSIELTTEEEASPYGFLSKRSLFKLINKACANSNEEQLKRIPVYPNALYDLARNEYLNGSYKQEETYKRFIEGRNEYSKSLLAFTDLELLFMEESIKYLITSILLKNFAPLVILSNPELLVSAENRGFEEFISEKLPFMNNDLVFNYYGGTLESHVRQELNKKFDTVSIVVPGAAPDAFVGVDALEYILYEITKFKKVNFDQNFGRMSLPSDAISDYVYEAVNNINRFFNTLLPEKDFKQKSNVSYSLNKSLNSFKIPNMLSTFASLAILFDPDLYSSISSTEEGRDPIITNTSYIQVKIKSNSNVARFSGGDKSYLDSTKVARGFLDGDPINLSPEDVFKKQDSFIYKILDSYLESGFVSEEDRDADLDSAFNRLLNENFEFYLTTEFFATYKIESLSFDRIQENSLYKETANKLFIIKENDESPAINVSFVRLAHHKQLFIPKLLDSEGPIGSPDASMIIECGTKTVDGEVIKIGDITDDLHKEFASKFMSKDSNINFVKEQISKNVSLIELLSYVSLSNIFNARTIYFSEEFRERDKKEKDFKEARGELTKELNHFVDSIADNIKGTLRSATIQ
jgi:hypothetical protein